MRIMFRHGALLLLNIRPLGSFFTTPYLMTFISDSALAIRLDSSAIALFIAAALASILSPLLMS